MKIKLFYNVGTIVKIEKEINDWLNENKNIEIKFMNTHLDGAKPSVMSIVSILYEEI